MFSLFRLFAQEALLKNRELAIGCLMGSWPNQVLQLHRLVPSLFTSVQPLYNLTHLGDIVKQGLRYTTNLAHTFLEALKNSGQTRLRFLDLSGFPTGMWCVLIDFFFFVVFLLFGLFF